MLIVQFISLIITNFNFTKMSEIAWISLSIALLYFFILVPFFAYIILSIVNEQIDETIQTINQKEFFNKMFDALQEGICTIDDEKIIYMNELCNLFTSHLSGLRDFENNIDENDEKSDINPLDRKIFFLF